MVDVSDAYTALAARLDRSRLRRAEPLAPYTTFRIGGPADLFYDATSADDLANAVLVARELALPYFVLGLGANILVGDKGVRGLVIHNVAKHHRFTEDGHLWTESGLVTHFGTAAPAHVFARYDPAMRPIIQAFAAEREG